MKVGKDRRIIFGAVIEISRLSSFIFHWNQRQTPKPFIRNLFHLLFHPQDPCHPLHNGFFVLNQKEWKIYKFDHRG